MSKVFDSGRDITNYEFFQMKKFVKNTNANAFIEGLYDCPAVENNESPTLSVYISIMRKKMFKEFFEFSFLFAFIFVVIGLGLFFVQQEKYLEALRFGLYFGFVIFATSLVSFLWSYREKYILEPVSTRWISVINSAQNLNAEHFQKYMSSVVSQKRPLYVLELHGLVSQYAKEKSIEEKKKSDLDCQKLHSS